MDVLFILHADHEQNCSTSAMRGVGSSHADPYSSAAAASAALYGPLHGGANEAVLKMLTEIGSKDRVNDFLKEVKSGSRRLMGFGHRVYKSYDPRAKIIKRTAYEVSRSPGGTPRSTSRSNWSGSRSRRTTSSVGGSTRTWTSTLWIIYEALGFPVGLFPVLFAVPRMSGWLAQWQEMLEDPEQKIARPKQLYLGYDERPVPAG